MTAETDSLPAGALAAAAILERIDEAVCALDRDRTITYANPAAAGTFGRPREELTGGRIEEVLPGFDEELREVLSGALRDGGTRRSDWAGGSVEIAIHPTPDGVWVRFRDVRARQAMEQLLRERDDILTMAERSAGIGVWDVDLATGMLRGTRQFWRIMGLPEIDHAVSIETTRALRLPDDRERVTRAFRKWSATTPSRSKASTASAGRPMAKSAGFSGAAG